MNKVAAVIEPEAPKPQASLRREVHNMLRDVAFVLAQTHRVRQEILGEQPSPNPAERKQRRATAKIGENLR